MLAKRILLGLVSFAAISLTPHFASAARITRLSTDPNKGMAGRCVQGLIDVLEKNYEGDIARMPYVVNREAFAR